ncbi:MAG: ABC transporter substrate-binding protein [Pseudolabrys sp.]|jgi:putative ABC transport system substrate-binding protein
MRRREFIGALGAVAVPGLLPMLARAQEAGRTYRLGGLHQSPRDAPHHVGFFAELRRQGFIDGQNLMVVGAYGQRPDQFAELAREQIKPQVEAMVCGGEAAARAAQEATKTIPIIVLADDMVRGGLVRSLAKPDSNTTGVSLLANELDGKRQEILIAAAPGVGRIAVLADTSSSSPSKLQVLQEAAQARGVESSIYQVTKPEEIAGAIDTAKASGAMAINVLASALLYNNRQIVFERVAAHRLPAIYQWPEIAEQDGLIGYGPRLVQIYRDIIARQILMVLRGAKPADIPVELPTRFELVINVRNAKAIGHEIPPGLVLRADTLIE